MPTVEVRALIIKSKFSSIFFWCSSQTRVDRHHVAIFAPSAFTHYAYTAKHL